MHIQIPRDEFLEAVGWTARILPAKPYTPILGGVYIVATATQDGGEVTFCAYDMELSAEVQPVVTQVHEEGDVVVSGRLLAAIAKVLPKADVYLRTEGNVLLIDCGKAQFTMPTMVAGSYPVLPDMPDSLLSVAAEDLSEAVSQVLPATSNDQALPHLMAICVEFTSKDALTLFGTDKNRVAARKIPWQSMHGDTAAFLKNQSPLVIPARALSEFSKHSGDVILGLTDGVLGLRAGKYKATSRLIDSPYPNCKAIYPKTHNALVAVDSAALRETLGRVLLLAEGEFPQVKLKFMVNAIGIEGGAEEVGGLTDLVPAEVSGAEQAATVNPRYLLAALDGCRADKVVIGLQGTNKPITVIAQGDSHEIPLDPDKGDGWVGLRADFMHILAPIKSLK